VELTGPQIHGGGNVYLTWGVVVDDAMFRRATLGLDALPSVRPPRTGWSIS
jgi:hypothetical protein